MTKLQFGIRSIATLTVGVAIFCTGYRLGFVRGEATIADNGWEQLGGPTSMGGWVSVLTTDGCKSYDIDASGNWTAGLEPEDSFLLNDPFPHSNPFAETGVEDDPFR